jgi:hypothetical protein
VRGKDLFLLGVFRRRLEYPALKRAVREQHRLFGATVVLIEDKASGTQLIQALIADGCMPSALPADHRQDHASEPGGSLRSRVNFRSLARSASVIDRPL